MKNKKLLEEEIYQVEAAFDQMAAESGLKKAFLAFAAEDAVIVRNNKVIKGKEAMAAYFDAQTLVNVQLTWSPDHVDVSDSGDMAYTFGKYSFSAQTQEGEDVKAEGIFHTVWKRQSDGTWKFVYD